MRIVVRNWRDQEPYVGHISALVWTLYQSHDKDETSPPEINRLNGISSFVKHGLQGHQHSDHHHHTDIEQLYFVLRGRGQLTIGDDKVDVRDGTAVYMPVNVPHQAFNDGDGWMEHLIVSCPLDEVREGTAAVCDWRDVHPVVLEGGTISWPLLQREEEADASDGGVLQRVHSVTRYAVQGRQGAAWQKLDTIELVHYVLSGYGSIEDQEGNRQVVTEGSAAHVLPGVEHRFVNQGEGWLEFVTFAVDVGEIEMPLETETDADEQSGDEEAAASVLAGVDWDEAEAVDTEEEIEEAVAVEAIDEVDAEESSDELGEEADADEAESEASDGEEDEEGDEGEEGDDDGEDDEGGGEIVAEDDDSSDAYETEAEEAEDDDSSDAYETEAEEAEDGDGADEDVASYEETDDADEAEDEGDDGEADESGDEVDDADEDDTDGDDGVADLTEEASDEDAEVEDAEEVDVESDEVDEEEESDEEKAESSTNSDSDDDSADDEDEIELEDDDADFDIEDEDEPAVGDDHEDEDDSPDPYRR